MQRTQANRNISRAEQVASDDRSAYGGYLVRFTRNGKRKQAFFGDSKYGGKAKALAAARAYRDANETPVTVADRVKLATRRTSATASKHVGVTWANHIVVKGDKQYEFVYACATWTKNPQTGARGTRTFSVGKYGKKGAWELAVQARAKGLREYRKALRSQLSVEA